MDCLGGNDGRMGRAGTYISTLQLEYRQSHKLQPLWLQSMKAGGTEEVLDYLPGADGLIWGGNA